MVPSRPDHLFLKTGRVPIRCPFTPGDLAENWSSSIHIPEAASNIGEAASPIDGLMAGEAVVGLAERWVDYDHLESAGIDWFRPGPLHYLSCLMSPSSGTIENTPEKYKTGLFGVGKEKKAIKSALLLIKALTDNDIPPINIDLIRVDCSGQNIAANNAKRMDLC